MSILTRENAKDHCRTCLEKLIKPEHGSSEDEMLSIQQCKSINVESSLDLKELLRKYIDMEVQAEDFDLMDLPQNVCIQCYKKLKYFEDFRRQAVENVKKLIIIFKDYNPENQDLENIDNIYKMLLKDSLMETESVLLNSPSISVPSVVSPDPDPFDASTIISLSQEEFIKEEYNISIDKMETLRWLDECNDSNSSSVYNDPEDGILLEENNSINVHYLKMEPIEHLKGENSQIIKNEKAKFKSSKYISEKCDKAKRRSKGTRNNFKCDQCNHSFAHKITLDAHIRKIHEGSKKPFQCDRCDKSYSFIGGLYTHIKEVHEVEVRSHPCDHPGCGRVYTSIIAMQKHKRLKHSETVEQKSYCCEQCGATFKQSGNLKNHMRTKHPTEQQKVQKEKEKEKYNCDICQKLFHSRYTLNYHKLQLHSGEMKYECNVCGRRMAKKFMLAQHMLVHSTDKMPCPHCTKQFIRKFELEAHIKAVHMKLKPFSCQYCGECFASRKTLRHHEYIHTGEKPYVCDICGQSYRQQTCLKNHRKLHMKNDELLETSLRNNSNSLVGNTI